MPAEHFQLTKWYLDCVAEDGDTAILYSAELSWRALHVGYSSILTANSCITGTRSALGQMQVSFGEDEIQVTSEKLGVNGSWCRGAIGVERTVFQSAEGSVHWRCLQPRSIARVRIADVPEVIGLGYAECLTLTIPPWRLPLNQLRWGRFASADDTVTWIDWQGAHSCAFAFHNGCELAIQSVSDTEVRLPDTTLQLDRALTLRDGALGDTVAPGVPLLRKLLPASLFHICETKWRSRGLLRTPEHEACGWAIHEVVEWKV